mmetsp:Transcript_40193/g.90118  ORF Transcript_40193/g.90118 Transcript_40193/m.90118 type:complete len:213 (-) Transcript_40193:1181-1819(-)
MPRTWKVFSGSLERINPVRPCCRAKSQSFRKLALPILTTLLLHRTLFFVMSSLGSLLLATVPSNLHLLLLLGIDLLLFFLRSRVQAQLMCYALDVNLDLAPTLDLRLLFLRQGLAAFNLSFLLQLLRLLQALLQPLELPAKGFPMVQQCLLRSALCTQPPELLQLGADLHSPAKYRHTSSHRHDGKKSAPRLARQRGAVRQCVDGSPVQQNL